MGWLPDTNENMRKLAGNMMTLYATIATNENMRKLAGNTDYTGCIIMRADYTDYTDNLNVATWLHTVADGGSARVPHATRAVLQSRVRPTSFLKKTATPHISVKTAGTIALTSNSCLRKLYPTPLALV